MADDGWRDLFTGATVKHFISTRLDHCPLLCSMVKEERQNRRNRNLMYEIMWERDEFLPHEIEKAWQGRAPITDLGDIGTTLKNILEALKKWSTTNFGAVTKQIEDLRERLTCLRL